MTPYFERDGITIYCGDCREVLPAIDCASVDLVLTDPPYGMNWQTDSTRFSGGNVRRGRGRGQKKAPIIGDKTPFDPSFLTQYGKHQIIWGWNHFPDKLPRGACLVWQKKHEELFGTFLSDAELAWKSNGCGVYCRHCKKDSESNAARQANPHPTKKPVSLMLWCLSFFPKARAILDPFMGSGTTLVAAKSQGIRAIGIELEESYCEIAARRLEQSVLDFTGG